MSTIVATPAAEGTPRQGPGYWRLFRSAAVAQLGAAVCLFGIVILLSLTGLVGLNSGDNLLIYAPWVIGGPWSLAASAGWAALLVALVSSILWSRLEDRLGAPLAHGLTMVSVAIGGYLPWLLTSSSRGRVGLSLFLMPAALRLVAFDASGEPRVMPARLRIRPRLRFAAWLCVPVFLVAPFALLHPLSVTGAGSSGGSFTNSNSGLVYHVRPGDPVQAETGLHVGLLPITVTGLRLVDVPSSVRVIRLTLGSNAAFLSPPSSLQLPARVAARNMLWFGYAIALRRCPSQPVGVTRVRVSYRELGVSLTQTVPLAGYNTLLSCE